MSAKINHGNDNSSSQKLSQDELNIERSQLAETAHRENVRQQFGGAKSKTTAIFAAGVVMLPILAIGSITYYFGSQTIDRHLALTRKENNLGLIEAELARERQLLAILSLGTGATALLSAAVAAWRTQKLRRRTAVATTVKNSVEEGAKLVPLSQSALQQNIFQEAVAEARAYLKCDRVAVYSLDRDRSGVIVAESVGTDYTSVLGTKIQDPWLEFEHLNEYRNGNAWAIDDLSSAEMSPRYLTLLEQLEIKASLIAPIVNNDLFGLLVAHQCQAPRRWQSGEIEYLKQLAGKTALALDNLELQEKADWLYERSVAQSRLTRYLTSVMQHIRQSAGDEVLEISVEEVKRVLQCDRAIVYSLVEQPGVVVAESVSPGYPRILHKKLEDPFVFPDLDEYRNGKARAIDNIFEVGIDNSHLQELAAIEVTASLLTPLFNEGELCGLLVAHQCQAPRHWEDYEIRWITQIATQVGLAIDNALLQKSNKRSSQDLIQSLNSFSLGISEENHRAEFMETAVEQARNLMRLDRVILCRSKADRQHKIIAQSVVPGYSPAIATQIDDCLTRQDEEVRRGQVEAIDLVDRANLSQPYLQQLQSLAVHSSLITPIFLQGDRLYGLLIAHQCQQPRFWSQLEQDLFAQLGIQLGLALDRIELQKLEIETALHYEEATETTNKETKSQELKPYPIADKTDLLRRSKPAQLSQVEISEITSSSPKNYFEAELITGELIESSESTTDPAPADRFAGEIIDLSDRISQQSSSVTESFQKLAALAKQLSEKEKP